MAIKMIFIPLLMTSFFVLAMYAHDELYVEKLSSINAFGQEQESGATGIFRGAFSQKAGLIAVVTENKILKFFAIPSLQEKSDLIKIPSNINDLSFSTSGAYLALALSNGRIQVYNTADKSLFKTLGVHSQAVNAVYFQDEGWIFSGGIESTLSITDLVASSNIGSISSLSGAITSIAVQADAVNCAVGLSRGEVTIFSIGNLSVVTRLKNTESKITTLSYSPDGKYLVAGTYNGDVLLWNAKSYELLKSFKYNSTINSISFDLKNRWMVIAINNGTLDFCDLKLLSSIKTITNEGYFSTYTAFINDDVLLTGTNNGKLETYRVSLIPPDSIKPGIVMENPKQGMFSPKAYAQQYELKGMVYDNFALKEATINGVPLELIPASISDANIFKWGKRSKAV